MIGGLLVLNTVAQARFKDLSPLNQITAKTFKNVQDTATTTMRIPVNQLYLFDGAYEEQGACFKIKDADSVGYTYLQVNNGTPTFSVNSCE